MDLTLSEEQQAIESLYAELLAKECPGSAVRAAEPLGFDAALWEKFAATDAAGMGLPAELGGGGASLLDIALVAERIGRAVAPVPLIEHAVAGRLLARTSPADPALAAIAAGRSIAALALRPARKGVAELVPAGAVAREVLALDGEELVAVSAAPPGAAPPNFASSPLADRRVGAGSGGRRVLARGADARREFESAVDEWRALTANALVGLAQGAFDMGLAYAKERQQFGKPIGAFQAIQHGLAEVAVSLDGARLLARKSAWAFEATPEDASRLARMAFLFCGELAQTSAARSLHYHGGYGFSMEYDIQLYFRRSKGWVLALDDPAREYQSLADQMYGREPKG
jgi:alkylation response protein AidB-like acyl-CoA dehydrogenase